MKENAIMINLLAQKEFSKLGKEERALCSYLKQVEDIKTLIKSVSDEDTTNVILNFKMHKDLGYTKFFFDIGSALSESSNDPYIINRVTGTLFETEQVKNIMFDVFTGYGKQSEEKTLEYSMTVIHQNTKISNSISLIENMWKFKEQDFIAPASVVLKVITNKEEEIQIPTDNYYYQLYRQHQIDITTFIHFILTTPHEGKTYPKKKGKKVPISFQNK